MSPHVQPQDLCGVEPRPPRILVVDDDPIIRMLLGELLAGCDVRLFGSAVDALSHLSESEPPDAILSDVVMPAMDGVTFFTHLTREQQSRTVFMTGGCSGETEAVLVTLGRPILNKPFSLHALRTTLGVGD